MKQKQKSQKSTPFTEVENDKQVLIFNEQVEESPIRIVGNEEKKEWFAVLGGRRISDIYESKEELETHLAKGLNGQIFWNAVSAIVMDVLLYVEEIDKQTLKKNKEKWEN